MAKFVRTLSGEFEDIVYSIEDYFTQNENIKLVDKVFIRDSSIKCFTIVFNSIIYIYRWERQEFKPT